MSIPDRLWRILKGRWILAGGDEPQSAEEALLLADAYRELADVLRPERTLPSGTQATGAEALPDPPRSGGRGDPLAACYELLQVQPGIDLEALDEALEQRLEEIRPERYPVGSPERAALEARRCAVQAAYERLRDALNPTETRFERLEF